MDSPQPLDDEAHSSSEEGSRQAAEGIYIRQDAKRRAMGPRAPNHRRTLAFGALAVSAALAVVVYAVARSGTDGLPSVTTKVPDADKAGAVVANLPPPNLLKPVSPDEALKENAERPFVARPDSAAARFVLKAKGEDRERAVTCLSQAIYYEAASEGVDGGKAVAQVILNRMRHPGYPASVCGVVYEGSDRGTGCQFTFTCDGSLLRPHVESLWTRSRKIAEEALSGKVFAPIGHATHYHADYVLPYWADSLDKSVQIGRHIFYRLKGVYGDGRSFFQHYAGSEPPIPDPRAIVVAEGPAATPEQEQLAKLLTSDEGKATPKSVEKIAAGTSPLIVDGTVSKLIVDEQAPPITSHKPKGSGQCPDGSDHKKLAPLGANDLRSGTADSDC